VNLGDDEAEVHVTQDMDDYPTSEMCPAVSITLAQTNHSVRYIVGALSAGNPDEITVTWEVTCFEFSGQGVKDANRRRNRLVRQVVDALRGDRTLGGSPNSFLETPSIRFQTVNQGGGIYAMAAIEVRVNTLG
jgi:hypothetical protein